MDYDRLLGVLASTMKRVPNRKVCRLSKLAKGEQAGFESPSIYSVYFAALAQLELEHRPTKPRVGSSSLSRGTKHCG